VFLLVDYSSLLYRAFFSTPSTIPMNGVHGCLNMLARVISDRRPRGVVLGVDDDWRPQFRVDALPMYKSQRVSDEPDPVTPQEQYGREVLSAIGLAVVGSANYEAEDVIATVAARTDESVEILSGDRDLFALVCDPRVKVLYPLRGTSDLLSVDEAEITRRYGIPGRAYGDFALLRGDPSDGLPGVAGIGEKTAAALIARYHTLEALRAASDVAPAVARKLAAARDYLDAACRVVLPVTDVPLEPYEPALRTVLRDRDRLIELLTAHRLTGAANRLLTALGIPLLAEES
jgi:5'-3' exonuclease